MLEGESESEEENILEYEQYTPYKLITRRIEHLKLENLIIKI